MEKLVSHPLSLKEESFVQTFKVPFAPAVELDGVESLRRDPFGNKYVECKAKQRTSLVTIRLYKGTGVIKIDSPSGIFNITFFDSITQREQILFPFKVIDQVNKFDMDIKVNQSGMSCLAKAIRYATSKALCSFIGVDGIEKLRLGIIYDLFFI
jgi:small subunit ribosomal protein S9